MTEKFPLLGVDEQMGSTDIDFEHISISGELGEVENDKAIELGDAEFERMLEKRNVYGLTQKNLWPWSMRLIQCFLCVVVCVMVVIVTRQVWQPNQPKHIRKREKPRVAKRPMDHHNNRPQKLHKQRSMAKAMIEARAKRANQNMHSQLEAKTEGSMDPRLRSKLSRWKVGQLSNEENLGRTPKSLLGFRKKPSPGKVPHHVFSANRPDFSHRGNLVTGPLGQNSLPSSRDGVIRADPRLGRGPRARTKVNRDPRARFIQQQLINRNQKSRNAGLHGRTHGRTPILGNNHHPQLSSTSKKSRPAGVGRNHLSHPKKPFVQKKNTRINRKGKTSQEYET
jgi:hypothetical protein